MSNSTNILKKYNDWLSNATYILEIIVNKEIDGK